MDRRNFLAFIPALSAIPIIGQAAERVRDKIIIYPEEAMPKLAEANWGRVAKLGHNIFVVTVHHEGRLFATGYATEVEFRHGDDPALSPALSNLGSSPDWISFNQLQPNCSIKAELFRDNNDAGPIRFEQEGQIRFLTTTPGDTANLKINVDLNG